MADLFVKYNCTNCQDDIIGIRVHCAECTDFVLCLQCFSAGAEIGEHRNDHDYQFMDTGTALSIYRGKGAWTARETLHLLDAIEKYGFGNWEDISKHIETRSAEDAKEEYISKFLHGTIGRHTWLPAQAKQPKLVDHTAEEDNGPLGNTAIQRLPPLDVSPEEAQQLGYMPNRDGFEREYDPSAEQLVSTLTLNPDDTETELLLKLAQVDIYTRRLRERARRKRIVRDYQLVANFFRGNQKQIRMTKDQREFRDRFRVFAQFYTAHEYDRLLASLERERDLRIRLSELNRYRWNGLTKIEECVHFEQHAALATNKNTGPYGHGRTEQQTTGNRQGSFSHSLHSRKINENGSERSSNSIGQKHMHPTGDPTSFDVSLHNKNYSDSYRGSSAMAAGSQPQQTQIRDQITTTTTTTTTHATISTGQQQQIQNQHHHHRQQQQHQHQNSNGNYHGNQQQQQKQHHHYHHHQYHQQSGNQKHQHLTTITAAVSVNPLNHQNNGGNNINSNDHQNQQRPQLGENLLSKNEIQLCASLNLPPTRYISLKTVLLSGAPLGSNCSPIESSIRKYLIKAGWLGH